MKTLFNFLLGKLLKMLVDADREDLNTVVKYVKEAASKFATSTEKREWVLSQLKALWVSKEESVLRYLLETAVALIKKEATK